MDIFDAGQDILVDDREFFDDTERNPPVLWIFVRKLWLPAFFLLTVLMNWDHPIILMTKVALFLISTKPSPLSVYVFVEEVRKLVCLFFTLAVLLGGLRFKSKSD